MFGSVLISNWLHQEAFDRYIERKKLYADQWIYIYVGTEEADDTDKTLMAGNIKQAYIDSSFGTIMMSFNKE